MKWKIRLNIFCFAHCCSKVAEVVNAKTINWYFGELIRY